MILKPNDTTELYRVYEVLGILREMDEIFVRVNINGDMMRLFPTLADDVHYALGTLHANTPIEAYVQNDGERNILFIGR